MEKTSSVTIQLTEDVRAHSTPRETSDPYSSTELTKSLYSLLFVASYIRAVQGWRSPVKALKPQSATNGLLSLMKIVGIDFSVMGCIMTQVVLLVCITSELATSRRAAAADAEDAPPLPLSVYTAKLAVFFAVFSMLRDDASNAICMYWRMMRLSFLSPGGLLCLTVVVLQAAVCIVVLYASLLLLQSATTVQEAVLSGVGIIFISEMDEVLVTGYDMPPFAEPPLTRPRPAAPGIADAGDGESHHQAQGRTRTKAGLKIEEMPCRTVTVVVRLLLAYTVQYSVLAVYIYGVVVLGCFSVAAVGGVEQRPTEVHAANAAFAFALMLGTYTYLSCFNSMMPSSPAVSWRRAESERRASSLQQTPIVDAGGGGGSERGQEGGQPLELVSSVRQRDTKSAAPLSAREDKKQPSNGLPLAVEVEQARPGSGQQV